MNTTTAAALPAAPAERSRGYWGNVGARVVRDPVFWVAATIVLSHQERWDGQGYPRNLQGQEIHIGARIFAVADTLDAMTSDRPYRRGTTFANAVAEITRCGGSQFDPEVVRAFNAIGETGLMRIKEDMLARRRAREASQQTPPGGSGVVAPAVDEKG